uniref:Eukaryotic translation initiation factor 2-alpha kinase 2 n=1 Tax=Knipowitschia caucasica TaxID=637954 RepID=A0AAV2JSH1_KNICA
MRLALKLEDVASVGPDHIKTFTVRAVVDGKAYPEGVGKNKKEARQMAAKYALEGVFNDLASESTETASLKPPPSPMQSTGIPQANYMCWLNQYGQRNNVFIKAVESTKLEPSNSPQCCKFVVGDKEYPEAYGTTKKQAREEAAKLVHSEIVGSESSQADDSALNQANNQSKIKVIIDGKEYPVAEGKSSKEAKQKAAQLAWSSLQEQSDWDSKVSVRSSEVLTPHVVVSPDVKPKIKLAASFHNPRRNQSLEGTPQQPGNSRFSSDYDCIETIGSGAFGLVFKARQKLLEKYFAVKIIRCKVKALREVKALSDLNHVNIVRYYTCWMEDTTYQDFSTDSGSSTQSTGDPPEKFLYIEMELCDTKTLRVWIDEKNTQNVKKSRRDIRRREESLKIVQQLISGVEYIHSQTLIHRDLKPANILFGRDEKVKIGDFGLVTAENDDEANVIERTVYKGTPSYMAPEQRNRKTVYDRKVDIFALGLIYFELLWKIETGHERAQGQIVKSMLSEQPQDRPEAAGVKAELEECALSLIQIKDMRTV